MINCIDLTKDDLFKSLHFSNTLLGIFGRVPSIYSYYDYLRNAIDKSQVNIYSTSFENDVFDINQVEVSICRNIRFEYIQCKMKNW